MRAKQGGLNEILEQPAMLSLLPDVMGYRVLDLGCGTGDLCRRIIKLGAKEVTGVDISYNMLDIASKEPTTGVIFRNEAIEDLSFECETFDLVVSSLVFHYIADLKTLFKNIHMWLKPSGFLLFSVEHPITTSSQGIHHGWIKDAAGRKLYWPVDQYNQEGQRTSHWFVDGVIKYHRTISTIINELIDAGFAIKRIVEPIALEEDEKTWTELAEARRRPPFLLVKAVRQGSSK
jgi:SAM-dependent methyltransferase